MSTTASNLTAPDLTVIGRALATIDSTPSPETIDACIAEYESAERLHKAAKDTMDQVKSNLILIVKQHGSVPDGASESKRLAGRHNTVTMTTGKTVTLKQRAIETLREYLAERNLSQLFGRMFSAETKYKVVESASEVLQTVDVAARTHEKIEQLFGCCIDVKTNSPSLKVQVITPEKPARAKRGKAA